MVKVEELYDAAQVCGLLQQVSAGAQTIWAEFRAPDETLLDGLVASRDPTLRYPASRLHLSPGDTLTVAGAAYLVRAVHAIGDGSEKRASLSALP